MEKMVTLLTKEYMDKCMADCSRARESVLFDQQGRGLSHISNNDTEIFIKEPHSLEYKLLFSHIKEDRINQERRREDNCQSMLAELFTERRNMVLDIITARYLPKRVEGIYHAFSPNMLANYDNATFKKLELNQLHMTSIMQALRANLSSIDYFVETLNASNQDILRYNETMKNMLKNKKAYLTRMTEECFNEIINIKLAALFDFSDDLHSGNIILFKQKGQEKYEHAMSLDNESKFFLPFVNSGLDRDMILDEILFQPIHQDRATVKVAKNTESMVDKYKSVVKLFNKGQLTASNLDIVKKITDINYDQIASDIENSYDIDPIDPQYVDYFKLGQEYADRVATAVTK